MAILSTDDRRYFQNHLEHWKAEMLLPSNTLDHTIPPELAQKHKIHVNETLDKLVLLLSGKPVKHRDAYFKGVFFAHPDDELWRTLLPLLFYLDCERSDVGRLMMADLKLTPFGKEEPLFAMTKGFYPSACVICQDPFPQMNEQSWATQKTRIHCERRSCRYEWDELMRPAFETALKGALNIAAIRLSIQRRNEATDVLKLETITDDTLPKIEEAYAYLLRFLYKREKITCDIDDSEPIKRQPFPPRYRKSLNFQSAKKEFWPGSDLRNDPSVALHLLSALPDSALQTPTALNQAVQKSLKAKKRTNK